MRHRSHSIFLCEGPLQNVHGSHKEIYIEWFKITESDLEKVVKSSCNSERFIIMLCNVSYSMTLYFTSESKYNIKFLSFYQRGLDLRTSSDWIQDLASIEHIVNVICKSGLRDSLQTFDIGSCKLDKTIVQRFFSKNGMWSITAIKMHETLWLNSNKQATIFAEIKGSYCLEMKRSSNLFNFQQKSNIRILN